MSFFYNPMMLMMLASVFFMVVMPKLMPEDMLKEMEQTQAQMGGGNPMDMLKKALSGEELNDGEASGNDDDKKSAVTKRKKR
jgi:hypothetical protein